MSRRTRLNDGDLLRAWHALAMHEQGAATQALQYFFRQTDLQPELDQASAPLHLVALPRREVPAETDLPLSDPVPVSAPPEPDPAPTPATERQVFWRVTEIEREPSDEPEAAPDATSPVEPVDDAVFCSPCDVPPPPREAPLTDVGALMTRLRSHLLRGTDDGRPDVQAAVRWIATGRPLHRLPPARQVRLPGMVQIVIEASSELGPLRHDALPVLERLGRWLGPRQRRLRSEGSPHLIRNARAMPAQIRLDGSPVVVLGDAGLLAPSDDTAMRWAHLGQTLAQTGIRPMLLLPAPPRHVRPEVARVFDVVAMDGDPAEPASEADPARWLRAAIFGSTYVRPGLLRRLRRVLQPWHRLDAVAEARLWNDAAVVSNISACALSIEQRSAAEADFAAWPLALREAVIETHLDELASMSPLVRAEYVLWVSRHVPASSRLRAVLEEAVREADRLMELVGARLQSGEDPMAQELEAHLLGFGERSAPLLEQGSDALQRAWVMAWRRGARPGDEANLLAGLRLQRLSGLLAPVLGKQALALTVQGRGAGVEVSVERADGAGAAAVLHRADGVPLWRMGEEWRPVGERVALSGERGGQVRFGGERVRVEPFARPHWAESIWFDQGEWHTAFPGGRELVWTPAGDGLTNACWWDVDNRRQWCSTQKPSWATQHGVDEFGHWAEFSVPSKRGSVTQRMRLIPPGEFLMGSPEDEVGHNGNERQHLVLMTLCYWLADTACTQKLWEAVMDENPSLFMGSPQNPVEQVSWNDIMQKFLPRLNKMVPGLNMTLPTEAQWEYACRAGIQTRYSFGDEINLEQVNFDGRRRTTVPVKALPSNPWGLHQMHGNVWEWCMDELAEYPEGTLIDPFFNQEKKENRLLVIRGGSWFDGRRNCRSAYRGASTPGERDDFFGHLIGFRLARGLADQPDQFQALESAGGGLRASWSAPVVPVVPNLKNNSTKWIQKFFGFGKQDKT